MITPTMKNPEKVTRYSLSATLKVRRGGPPPELHRCNDHGQLVDHHHVGRNQMRPYEFAQKGRRGYQQQAAEVTASDGK